MSFSNTILKEFEKSTFPFKKNIFFLITFGEPLCTLYRLPVPLKKRCFFVHIFGARTHEKGPSKNEFLEPQTRVVGNKRGHSLVWLEYWPVTPKVAGSSPVVLEMGVFLKQCSMFWEPLLDPALHVVLRARCNP